MNIRQAEEKWREAGEEVITGMREWREQHPKATLRVGNCPYLPETAAVSFV